LWDAEHTRGGFGKFDEFLEHLVVVVVVFVVVAVVVVDNSRKKCVGVYFEEDTCMRY
jgi:Mn2+/Fe2+ NRAMP family transporter